MDETTENLLAELNSSEPSILATFSFQEETLCIYRSTYNKNKRSLAIFIHTEYGEPYAVLSEYHEGIEQALAPNEFVLQSRNVSKEFCKALLETGIFEPTGRALIFGPFGCKEPIWRLRSMI